ncbi:tetratricopeptide repeat protein [Paenibacillus piri]|uniref:Tetratricopeptide repeat protein n=1 Tax=Paenibacillus piri TaxID=2547395 RepID=A0A4R5KQH6_9BACL|nr:tetratricopeptide repeat protein [Paenibacillus piri]TDF97991.1 tetratricopeptide repeat protein [Paenibacillus piri]
MAGCSFQLLGSLKIAFDDEAITEIPGKKAGLLLSYLILAFDMPLSRKHIAFDFWPDSTEKQALSNLRKLIHDLRECLPLIDRYLQVTPTSMQWKHELPCYSDVREFEQAAQGKTLYELRKAEELYRGELLPGFYEEWLIAKRELLAQTYLNVLDKLISILESQREYSSAVFFANKLLLQNKLREETYRTLMRLNALNKDMVGVVQIYEQLRCVLEAELGIAPAEETLQLFGRLTENGGNHSAVEYRQTPLIGRIDEWSNMLSVWQQAKSGRTSMLLLKGEAGIGKTRLALEFKAWVESQGIQTAFAGCYPTVRSLSYTPVTSWLRSLPLPQMNPVWLSELARLLPELFERIPGLPMPDLIKENWQLTKWYEAIERMLLAEQPLLLILDDIQWSDRETLQFISYLLRSGSKAKLLVLATMRTDESADDAVGHFFSGLRIELKITDIELAPFGEEDTKRLMAAIVGNALADRNSSGLYKETGGNPLFIVETMREWQRGSSNNEFRLSPLVRTIIENRLSRLSPESIQLLLTAAAVGRPVLPEFMAIILEMREEAVLEKMEQLVQLKIILEVGEGQYDFTHDIVREVAYKLKNDSRRRQCHRQIARSLSEFHHGQPEAVAAEIALHYELAGMEKEAIVYYEMAALAAEKIYANDTRIKYYQKLCALLSPEQILPVLMKLGDALIIAGDWNEAERTYRQWLEHSENSASVRERSLCDVALGNCLRLQGKYEEAGFHLERALRCYELMEDHSGLSSVYVTLGVLHYYRGYYEKALYYLKKRTELPHAGNQAQEDCRVFGIIGHLFYDQCEYDQAIHWIKKQIGLAIESRDRYTIEQAMGILAMVYMDLDEMDQAFGFIADKLKISRSIGDRMGFANAHGMLGKYYWYLGHHERAAPCIIYCLEEAVVVKDWRVAAIMLSYEGRNLLAQQRLDEADLMIDRSIRLFNQLRTPYFACETLYFMSLLRQCQNQYENAVKTAEEALDIANRLKRKDMRINLLVQLSYLRTDLGWISSVEAADQLQRMLEQYPGQQEQAALRYAMWKLNPQSQEHRSAALLLNRELYLKSGKKQYFDRCGELNGFCPAYAARPLPQLAVEIAQSNKISPKILDEIDQYLSR